MRGIELIVVFIKPYTGWGLTFHGEINFIYSQGRASMEGSLTTRDGDKQEVFVCVPCTCSMRLWSYYQSIGFLGCAWLVMYVHIISLLTLDWKKSQEKWNRNKIIGNLTQTTYGYLFSRINTIWLIKIEHIFQFLKILSFYGLFFFFFCWYFWGINQCFFFFNRKSMVLLLLWLALFWP